MLHCFFITIYKFQGHQLHANLANQPEANISCQNTLEVAVVLT